jgi:VanZ family protein
MLTPTASLSFHTVCRLAAAFVLVAVVVLSFLPSDSADPMRVFSWNSVDLSHVVAYAALAGTALLSVPRLTLWQGTGMVLAISLLGLAIEVLQPLVGRTTSVVDFTENEIGIATGIVMFCVFWIGQRIRARDRRPDAR